MLPFIDPHAAPLYLICLYVHYFCHQNSEWSSIEDISHARSFWLEAKINYAVMHLNYEINISIKHSREESLSFPIEYFIYYNPTVTEPRSEIYRLKIDRLPSITGSAPYVYTPSIWKVKEEKLLFELDPFSVFSMLEETKSNLKPVPHRNIKIMKRG